MNGKLYLCPTPIGNLGDITMRTLETLRTVDLIAAEDTRVSMKILNHFEITKPITSYYEHNKRDKGPYLIEKLKSGLSVAIITDAGMPGISDPGEDLVKLCIENDIAVESLPGACAFATALVASGLPTSRFTFEGFLSMNKKTRFLHLNSVKNDTRTLIFYEAPHKVLTTLKDMYEIFGERKIVLAREITKKFEEYIRTTFTQAIEKYQQEAPRGEFVIMIDGVSLDDLEIAHRAELPTAEELLLKYMKTGEKGKDIVKKVALEAELPKNEVYSLYLTLKDNAPIE